MPRRSSLKSSRRFPDKKLNQPKTCKCGTVFTPRPRTLSTSKCADCAKKAKREKQESRRLNKLRSGSEPNRARWNREKRQLKLDCAVVACEVCGIKEAALKSGKPVEDAFGEPIPGTQKKGKLVGDHIIPLRMLSEMLHVENPNTRTFIIWLCPACHGRKKLIEDKLCQGKTLDFLLEIRKLDWPMTRVIDAFDAADIWVPLQIREQVDESFRDERL